MALFTLPISLPSPTHYDTLGLLSTATADEVERAFRRRAFETHPDHNPDDTTAAARFRSVRAAYEVLRDPARRVRYDAALAAATARPALPPRAEAFSVSEIVIRKGRPRGAELPTGLLVGLVEGLSRSVLVILALIVLSVFGATLSVGMALAVLVLDILIVGGVIRYIRMRRARRAASPTPPTGEIRFTLDAEGLHDHRRHLRLHWSEVRGYVVSWPEDWMELTLTQAGAARLRASGALWEHGGRYVYRLDLKGTDGELVDVERLLQHALAHRR